MLNERKIQHHERSHLNFEMHPQEPLFRGLTERNEAIGIRAVKRVCFSPPLCVERAPTSHANENAASITSRASDKQRPRRPEE